MPRTKSRPLSTLAKKKQKEQEEAKTKKYGIDFHKAWEDIKKAREEGDEPKQEELLKDCLKGCEKIEASHSMRVSTEISMAVLLANQGRQDEALPFLDAALQRLRKYHKQNEELFADTYLHASNCNRYFGRYREAERLATAALKINNKLKLKEPAVECHEALFLCRYTLGCELIGAGKYKPAVDVLLRTLENIKPAAYQRRWREGMARCCLGACYSKLGKIPQALAEFEQSLELLMREKTLTMQDLHYLFFSIEELAAKVDAKRAGLKRVLDTSKKLSAKLRRMAKISLPKRVSCPMKLHGKTFQDPYRWLEDVDSDEVLEWSRKENEYAELFLCTLDNKALIHSAIDSSVIRHKPTVPVSIKKKYYFVADMEDPLEKALWTCTANGKRKKLVIHPYELIKPNEGGITNYVISPNGRHVAFGVTQGGSEWQTWRIFDMTTRKILPDVLTGLIHEYVLWMPGGKAFLYIRHTEPKHKSKRAELLRFPAIYLHRVGTKQTSDKLIYRRLDKPNWYIGPSVALGGKLALLTNWTEKADRSIVLAKQLLKSGAAKNHLLPVFPKGDASYRYFTSRRGKLYFITDKNADKGRIVSVSADLAKARFGKPAEVLKEREFLLDSAYEGTSHLLVQYLENGFSRVRKFDWNTLQADGELKLPFSGTVSDLRWADDVNTYLVAATSYLHPETIFKFAPNKKKPTVFFQSEKPNIGHGLTTTLVKYKSKDGTEIPMHLVHKKGIKLDGNQPVLLYVYGGFGRCLTPEYTYDVMAWLKLGGVYAAPLLRGGGELGTKWHTDAILEGKNKTIEDIAAAAEWLKANNWTNSKRIAVYGGSNGGLTAAATLVRYPKLFAAGVIINGLYDMLRYHRSTLAWTWLNEYGSAENKEQFEYLRKYSPLHNLKTGEKYPPIFISAARGDDRVLPWHSFKFAAALRHAQNNKGLVLLRVEEEAGHAWSRPSDRVKDQLLFLMHVLKM